MGHEHTSDEAEVQALQTQMWNQWNTRNAAGMAALFTEDGSLVGFDGSQVNGRSTIEANMGAIFAHHTPATYVGIIQEVRFLSPNTAVLRSIAGMIPPGQSDLKAENNSIISLIAVKGEMGWKVALYHNTPARFDGRPEAKEQMTEELRQRL